MYSNRFYEAAVSQSVPKHVECTWGSLSLDGLGSPHNIGQPDTTSAEGWGLKKQNLQKVRSNSEPKKSRNDSQKGKKQDFGKTK